MWQRLGCTVRVKVGKISRRLSGPGPNPWFGPVLTQLRKKILGQNKGVQSMFRKTITAAVLAVGAAAISAGPALAGPPPAPALPAPGVLGLVAIGVIAAIALARSRK